jgi:hypothetical protein
MTFRENMLAILNYQNYDHFPVVHFGFWTELLAKWADEGFITRELADNWGDGNPYDVQITKMLGFDYNYYTVFQPFYEVYPYFEEKVVKEFSDGTQHVQDDVGVIVLRKPNAGAIPAEIEHLLTNRASWEEHYKWRYQFSPERVEKANVLVNGEFIRFDQGGLDYLKTGERDNPYGLHCGSLYGQIRDVIGLVGTSYMMVDDPELFDEIIDTVGTLCYEIVKYVLDKGAKFDFAHFWEDICFKNGPLIRPSLFEEKVGPHYKRITDLVNQHGMNIVSLDCDGLIDELIPTWLNNGVNTMFPIEVGTWDANIAPWRKKYGRDIRGVGGTDKKIFAKNRAAIDAEIDRMKPWVELGGFIPCPDHRLPLDAEWDLVKYYCERARKEFN